MDFSAAIETWRRVLTQPGEPAFEQEKYSPNATLQTALIWMAIAGVVAAIFGFLAGLVGASSAAAMLSQMDLPPEAQAQMGPMISAMTGSAGLAAIITVPLFFLIGSFILHLLAKMFGGQGEFSTFAYLSATYQAPLTAASAVLSVIPFAGGCVAALLGIYSYVLAYFAVKVNYGLTNGRAIAVVLIPIALLVVLAMCFGVLVVGLFSAASN